MSYYPQLYPNYNQYANQIQQPQQSMRGNSLISVRSEEEARMYPVAPGNSVTFKDENTPYIYTKTMGFSQLDRPVFEKYKLIKEEVPEYSNTQQPQYALKNDLLNVVNKITELEEEIIAIRGGETKRQDEVLGNA